MSSAFAEQLKFQVEALVQEKSSPFEPPTRANGVGIEWLAKSSRPGKAVRAVSHRIDHLTITDSSIDVESSFQVPSPIIHIATSSDDRLTAVALEDGSLHVYEKGGNLLFQHKHSQQGLSPESRANAAYAAGPLRTLAFAPDSYDLLMVDGTQLKLIRGNQLTVLHESVLCACWKDGSTITAGCIDGSIVIVNAQGTEITLLPSVADGCCTHVQWLPNQRSLLAGYCLVSEEKQDEDDENDSSNHEVTLCIMDLEDGYSVVNTTDLGDFPSFWEVPKYGRHVYYTDAINSSSGILVFVACNLASDVAIISNESGSWEINETVEGQNIQTPVLEDEFTYPIGLCVVYTDSHGSYAPKVMLTATDGSVSARSISLGEGETLGTVEASYFGPALSSDFSLGDLPSTAPVEVVESPVAAPVAASQTESETEEVISLDTPEAKRAASAFDSIDLEKTGFLPAAKLEDLLDQIGEGLYGDELDKQLHIMDPDDTGSIKRSSFIYWYTSFALEDDSEDSDEEEKEEERDKARKAFKEVAKSVDGKLVVVVDDFPKVIEACGTTYNEEEHKKTIEKLVDEQGVIQLDNFLVWYIDWLFGGDEDSIESEESKGEDATASNQTSNQTWGANMFSTDGWKCDACLSQNKESSRKCAACEAVRPGFEDEVEQNTPAKTGSIGSGGFTFGVTPSTDSASTGQFSFSAPAPSSGFGFSFGSNTETSSEPASSSGGFSFSFGGTNAAPSQSSSDARVESKQEDAAATKTEKSSANPSPFTFSSSTQTTSSLSSPAFPPLSSTAPSVFGESSKPPAAPASTPFTPAPTASSSAFPPLSKTAPSIFGGSSTPSTTATVSNAPSSAAFPPLSKTAPSVFGGTSTPAPAASSSTALPPLSKTAPSIFGGSSTPAPAPVSSSSAAFPPLSKTSPSIFGGSNAPTPAPTPATSSSAAMPPLSKIAPSIFGALNTTAPAPTPFASSSAALPPLSKTAPSIFGGSSSPAPASSTSSSAAFPPLSNTSPSIFGGTSISTPASAPATSSNRAMPPLSKTAPSIFGGSSTPAPASTSGTPSVAFPPLSKTSPSIFGGSSTPAPAPPVKSPAPAPASSSSAAFPPLSKTSPSIFGGSSTPAPSPAIKSPAPAPVASSGVAFPPLSKTSPSIFGGSSTPSRSSTAADLSGTKTRQSSSTEAVVNETPSAEHFRKSVLPKIQSTLETLKMELCIDRDFESKFHELTVAVEKLENQREAYLLSLAKSRKNCVTVMANQSDTKQKQSTCQESITRVKEEDFSDDQALDAASEQKRRALNAESVRVERKLDFVEDRLSFLSSTLKANGHKEVILDVLNLLDEVKQLDSDIKSTDEKLYHGIRQRKARRNMALSELHSPKAVTKMQLQPKIQRMSMRDLTMKKSKFPIISKPGTDPRSSARRPASSSKVSSRVVERINRAKESLTFSQDIKSMFGSNEGTLDANDDEEVSISFDMTVKPSAKPPAARQNQFKSSTPESSAPVGTKPKPAGLGSASFDLPGVSTQVEGKRSKSAKEDKKANQVDESNLFRAKQEVPPKKSEDSFGFAGFGQGLDAKDSKLDAEDSFSFKSSSNPSRSNAVTQQSKASQPAPSPFGSQKDDTSSGIAAFGSSSASFSMNEGSSNSFGASSLFGGNQSKPQEGPTTASPSPFGSSASSTSAPTPFGLSSAPAPFGSASSSTSQNPTPFGSPAPAPAFGAAAPSPTPFGSSPQPQSTQQRTFGGKTAREMLAAFYQQRNPTKIGDVEKLLTKYNGREEALFLNLAKKYNIDPAQFGISGSTAPAPTAGGFGSPAPSTFGSPAPSAFASTSSGFGQPSQLGGGTPFGSPSGGSTFGSPSPLSSGFGASSAPSAAFGSSSAFGSASSSTSTFGSQGFGGFGQAAPSPSPFGSPTPFGGPRR